MNIIGNSECTASQMAQYLIARNSNAKSWALEYAQLYLEEGEAEGVRGDGAWIQSCKETGNFKFNSGTAVTFDQNNFCGLGVTRKGLKGHSFDTPRLGIRAQIQHLKGYATTISLVNACIDPRYNLINPKGCAPRFEDLAGRWAVPGYDTNKASSLEDAMNKGIGYGFDIVAGVNIMKAIKVTDVKEEANVTNPVIALSAGHGLYTVGKRCLKSIDPNETREWVLNDRIVDKVEEKLKGYYCTVVRVNDTTGKIDTPLATRVTTANNKNADIYLSMHHNAAINGGSGGGTLVYYYPTGDRKAIATKLYNHIVACTGLKGNRSTPVVSTTELYEPKAPNAISFLIENGFMDSTTDTPIILTEEHAERTAVGVVNFLVEYFNLKKNGNVIVTTPSTTPSTIINKNFPTVPFQVQVLVSDLNIRKTPTSVNNSNLVGKCTGKGTFTIVEVQDGWGLLKSYQQNRNGWIYLENASYCKIGSTLVNSTVETNKFSSYKVKVTDNALNIRKGAGTNYGIVGTIKDKGIYTIVDEATGVGATKWGLLKAYETNRNGWISLDFVKKI